MRTTLTIDDEILAELKERAHREGVPFKQLVNRVLRRGLQSQEGPSRRESYRATTHSMGTARVPNLDKALEIAGELEDEELARKLRLRK